MILARHSLSKALVAIKSISKSKIDSTFGKNGASFNELELMDEVCRGQVPNMLPMIESFESDTTYFIVTKYLHHGDLTGYMKT